MLATREISVGRPCCYRKFTLTAIVGVPIETYSRRCRACAISYHVRRETISVGPMIRDSISWLNTASREYQNRYGR